MTIECNKLVIKSDNTIALGDPTDPTFSGPAGDRRGLYDEEIGAYVNAGVTVTLEDLIHVETQLSVAGLTPPDPMAYVSGSNGVYRVDVPASVGDNLIQGDEYEGEIKVLVIATGKIRTFFVDLYAERG